MWKTAILLSLVGLAFSPLSAKAQQRRFCFRAREYMGPEAAFNVYVGDRFNLRPDGSGEPSYIVGEVTGSQVNVRPGPGTEYESDGSYGLVGEYVTALQWGYDQNCEEWYLVRFPRSGYQGWIKGTYINFVYGRGLFD